jgi:hypothetical protein
MPATGKWGNPAPSGPLMVVPERQARPDATEIVSDGYETYSRAVDAKPTATKLREQMQARAEDLRAQLASMEALQAELALIERMLEVK